MERIFSLARLHPFSTLVGAFLGLGIPLFYKFGPRKSFTRYKKEFQHFLANSKFHFRIFGGNSSGGKIPEISHLEVVPGLKIIRLLGCNPGNFTLEGTNTYLIGNARERILVDAGEGKRQYRKNLLKVLKEEDAVVKTILITHWHFDHIGGVDDLLRNLPERQNIKVFKHSLSHAPQEEKTDTVDDVLFHNLVDSQSFDLSLEDKMSLKVLHTPGHTKDHVCVGVYQSGALRCLLSGDCILGEGTAVFEDLGEYIAGLKKILNLRTGDEAQDKAIKILPGHGNVVENGFAKVEYYIKHREERESQILQVIKKDDSGSSVSKIVEEIYGHLNLSWKVKMGAKHSVKQHLKKLLNEKRIFHNKKEDTYGYNPEAKM